ncbi:MAG: ferredoxin [Polaromonas sp.]|nr:ferredoxin [Polaromonas sp.]
MIRVTFITPDDKETVVAARAGDSLLEAAQSSDVPMLGTCGGSMICATCHVMIGGAAKLRIPPPGEEEIDVLELAFGVTDDSRLACQVRVCEMLDGAVVRLAPKMF